MSESHSIFSASASHRWLACPGSIALSAKAPRRSSSAARRGTAAHEVAAQILQGSDLVDPRDVEGRVVHVEGEDIEIDEDLAEQVRLYVEYVRGFSGVRLIETRSLYAAALGLADSEAWGTADAVVITPTSMLHVIDLKTGRRWVGAQDNPQLLLYAAGIAEALKAVGMDDYTRVTMHIVQPAVHNVPATWVLTRDEFEAQIAELRAKASEADRANFDFTSLSDAAWVDQFLRPSEDACEWCPAASFCPKLAAVAAEHTPSAPASSDDVLGIETADLNAAMAAIPLLETWIAAIQGECNRRASVGEPGLDFKLVLGRAGNRKWGDAQRVQEALKDLPRSVLWAEPALQSPAQLEKSLKKLKQDVSRLDDLVVRSPAKPTLVPASDPRPQWTENDIANEFDIVGK